jgi:hydroxyethylthiazole kinase-like uncharacterized protein yjeF
MIIGTGIDIIEIARIDNLTCKEAFLKKMFTQNEIAYLETKKTESIAGYFCAKEAVVKSLGTGFFGFKFTDIEILKKNSAPYVVLYGKALALSRDKGIKEIHVSISHSKEYANAIAVAEGSVDELYRKFDNNEVLKRINDDNEFTESNPVVPISYEKDYWNVNLLAYPKSLLKIRKIDSHKGDYGRVYIIGGCFTMSGAVILAAKAALRSGAGLVTCVIPKSIIDRVGSQVLEATYMLSEGNDMFIDLSICQMDEILNKCDAIALGIGMGKSKEAQKNIEYMLENSNKAIVIDADGINMLYDIKDTLKKTKTQIILTPHSGEMARLTDLDIEYINENRQDVAVAFAKEYNCIILLKGASTIVTDGKRVYINTTGNPGMASGGSGDALTGIIVSLIGQGYGVFDSAALGAYLHGMAGDSAFSKYGYGLLASDLIDCIGNYLKG